MTLVSPSLLSPRGRGMSGEAAGGTSAPTKTGLHGTREEAVSADESLVDLAGLSMPCCSKKALDASERRWPAVAPASPGSSSSMLSRPNRVAYRLWGDRMGGGTHGYAKPAGRWGPSGEARLPGPTVGAVPRRGHRSEAGMGDQVRCSIWKARSQVVECGYMAGWAPRAGMGLQVAAVFSSCTSGMKAVMLRCEEAMNTGRKHVELVKSS